MKVLVVEDDANIRRILIRLLRRMFDVVDSHGAESVDEAVALLGEAVVDKPYDLIICDWDLLGQRKGGDVLAWVRAHASQLERRFMFLSANEAIRSLGVCWLDKPSDIDTIRRAIQQVVNQSEEPRHVPEV